MIDKKEAIGVILLLVIVGLITLLSTFMDKKDAIIADLKKINDSKDVQIMNLDYQLNQCRILHVEGLQSDEISND